MQEENSALWIKNPLAILADGAGGGVVVQAGRIVELVPAGRDATTPNAKIFDASEHVVLPGLINTHHHFYQTLTRAVPAALDRELFPWLQALYPIWAGLTPESLDLGMSLAMAELLLSGCTTTTDHHYVFPAGLEDSVDIEVAAAERLGIRVLLTRGSMNLSQRDGGLPPDSVVQDEDTILADSERVVKRYHEAGDDAMVQIALAPVLTVFGDHVAYAPHRGNGGQAECADAYSSSRDRGREPVLPANAQLPAARLPRRLRLAQRSGLARPRHSLQRKRDEAARAGGNDYFPLPL
jgi:cytosine/adenosine deaminase-related metal-dependent hydrolase